MLESVNDVQHKKHAVTEFLDAEEGSDRNIHQCPYNIYGKSAVDRSTVGQCLIRATASETEQCSMICLVHFSGSQFFRFSQSVISEFS